MVQSTEQRRKIKIRTHKIKKNDFLKFGGCVVKFHFSRRFDFLRATVRACDLGLGVGGRDEQTEKVSKFEKVDIFLSLLLCLSAVKMSVYLSSMK